MPDRQPPEAIPATPDPRAGSIVLRLRKAAAVTDEWARQPNGAVQILHVTWSELTGLLRDAAKELTAKDEELRSLREVDKRWSMTFGELPASIRHAGLIEPHEWDNKNISEQRDWAVTKLAEHRSRSIADSLTNRSEPMRSLRETSAGAHKCLSVPCPSCHAAEYDVAAGAPAATSPSEEDAGL